MLLGHMSGVSVRFGGKSVQDRLKAAQEAEAQKAAKDRAQAAAQEQSTSNQAFEANRAFLTAELAKPAVKLPNNDELTLLDVLSQVDHTIQTTHISRGGSGTYISAFFSGFPASSRPQAEAALKQLVELKLVDEHKLPRGGRYTVKDIHMTELGTLALKELAS